MSQHHKLVNVMNALLCQVKKDVALFKDWDLRLKNSSAELMSDVTLSSEFTKCTAFAHSMLQVATVVNIHTYINKYTHTDTHTHTHTHIYIYVCVCVYVTNLHENRQVWSSAIN
jgi:bacterioferritin-associated ferredoxin